MNFCPDLATNSREEWRLSLFQSNLRKQIGKLLKFLKFVEIVQYHSILFIRVLTGDAGGGSRGDARLGPLDRPVGPRAGTKPAEEAGFFRRARPQAYAQSSIVAKEPHCGERQPHDEMENPGERSGWPPDYDIIWYYHYDIIMKFWLNSGKITFSHFLLHFSHSRQNLGKKEKIGEFRQIFVHISLKSSNTSATLSRIKQTSSKIWHV